MTKLITQSSWSIERKFVLGVLSYNAGFSCSWISYQDDSYNWFCKHINILKLSKLINEV